MKFFSQELNFIISSPIIREVGKNYFPRTWKNILHCFSSHSLKQHNVKSKKVLLNNYWDFSYIYFWSNANWELEFHCISFRITSINVFKAFSFLKLSSPIAILYLHLSARNKLLPNVFLITIIYLHFISDNTLLLFRHRQGPWFQKLPELSLSRTLHKPTFTASETDSWATLHKKDLFPTACVVPSILLSDSWKGRPQLTSFTFFPCSEANSWAPTQQI